MKIYSDISLMWLLPVFGVIIFFTFWFYKKSKVSSSRPKTLKATLISLRSLGLLSLVVLLFGLLFEIDKSKLEKPIFINLIDNSKSMLNYQDSSNVNERIKDFKRELSKTYGDEFEIKNYYVGQEIHNDSLDFNSDLSDLNQGFEFVFDQYYNANIGAICFITDGVYNSGMNPVYSAERLKFTPIYSLGVGDTIQKVDHLIKGVNFNKINYYKNKFPIEINIESHQLNGEKVELRILKNGKIINTKKIEYKDDAYDLVSLSILIDANTIGINEYSVQLESLDNEVTLANNSKSFFIETIDSRNKILIISDSPHPDVSAIKSSLDRDENTEVEVILTKDVKSSLKGYELVVLRGHSVQLKGFSEQLIQQKTSVLYLLTSETTERDVAQLKLNLNYPSGSSSDKVQGSFSSGFSLFEISDNLKASFDSWPPLSVKFGDMKSSNGVYLLNQSIGGVVKQSPLVYFGVKENVKYGVITGENIWRWKITNFEQQGNAKEFDELIFKIKQYLSVKRSLSPLQIDFPERISTNKNLMINASIFNASLEPVVGPVINLSIINSSSKEMKFTFTELTSSYNLNVGQLTSGIYKWKADTKFNNKTYKKEGQFIVDEVSVEKLSTKSNFNILNKISQNSGGVFVPLKDYRVVLDSLSKRSDIAPVQYIQKEYEDIISMKWLLIFIVLFLGSEWFLRKYFGLI